MNLDVDFSEVIRFDGRNILLFNFGKDGKPAPFPNGEYQIIGSDCHIFDDNDLEDFDIRGVISLFGIAYQISEIKIDNLDDEPEIEIVLNQI